MKSLPEALQPLAAYKQFILWINRPSTTRPGAVDKLPIHPETGAVYNAHDPTIQLYAVDAIQMAPKHRAGVGFVFTANDPFFFLDIDKCYDPTTKQWSARARELCTTLSGAAVEVSQSGQGLHIIGSGPVVPHGCRNIAEGLELYTSGRFVALTGTHAVGRADFRPPAIDSVINQFFPPLAPSEAAEWTTEPVAEWSGPADDDELIKKILKSKQNAGAIFQGRASIQDLWNADEDALAKAYPDTGGTRTFDHSSADMALCQHLAFWTGKDCERIDRLFRQSKLYRDKWESRSDYRQRTILNAVGLCKSVYGSREAIPENADPLVYRSGTQYMPYDQQLEHFKGCIYVRDLHRIFMPDGALLKPEQFNAMRGGFMFQQGEKSVRKAWEIFTESQGLIFPKAESICFRPEFEPGAIIEEEGRKLVNTYIPITTPRKAGDISPFRKHLALMLPVERDRTILLSYMAACIQYPGTKFQWTPLIQGCEGNGKTTLVITCMAHAIGHRYTHLPNASELGKGGAKFNSWIQNKLFIGVEEVYVSDKREVLDALKPLITNPRIEIQGKGLDQVTGDNRANFIMCSNHKDAILKTRNDRRFCVFFTAQQEAAHLTRDGMDGAYFPDLYKWLRADGYAIVADYLANYEIPAAFNPAEQCHRAPDTSSTDEAVAASLGGIEQEILEAVEEDRPGFAHGWISSMALDKLIEDRKDRKRIPPNRRKEILQSLGYKLHPALKKGRTNIVTPLDLGKPRLYIKRDHIHAGLTDASNVTQIYIKAQEPGSSSAPVDAGAVFNGNSG